MDDESKTRSRGRARSPRSTRRHKSATECLASAQPDEPSLANFETQSEAGLIRLADREIQEIEWLWPGQIPLGKCTLLVGDPDSGKSFLTLDLAARVTRGLGVPPEPGLAGPGSVLLLCADDHINDTILPRLSAAGADLERVALLPRTVRREVRGQASEVGDDAGEEEDERLLSLVRDLGRVERGLAELGDCRLVVIDPISAYLKGVDTYNNITVRHHLLKLSDLAERYGAAFVLVSHQRKAGAATAMYRAIGSLAFTAVARVVLMVTADKAVLGRRLLLPVKMTLQTTSTGRAFSIVEGRVEWEPEVVPYTADEVAELVKSGEGSIDVVRETVEWLKELLPETDLRIAAEEVQRRARERNVPKAVLWEAKKVACVKAVRDGKEQKWYWQRIVSMFEGVMLDEDEWTLAKKRAGI